MEQMMGEPRDAERLLVVLSDIEMGAGGQVDDFPHPEFLAQMIEVYSHRTKLPVSFVFNGDTFDFLKIAVDGVYSHHITSELALAKFERLEQAHRPFFDALAAFLAGDAAREVFFVVGNHDMELLFPSVQEAIAARLGGGEQTHFPGLELRLGAVHIEHGHQLDPMFRVEPEQPFVEHQGEEILNLPWGSVALLEVAIPLQPWFYALDRMRPRKQVLELLPEVKELLTSLYWRYWTRDYLRTLWNKEDPIKRLNWSILKEIVYRFRSQDPDIWSHPLYRQMLQEQEDIELLLTGHDHSPGWWSWENRKYLHTGCMRNEYLFAQESEDKALCYTPVPRVYAEVWLRGEAPIRSYLVEIDGPEMLEGYMPTRLSDFVPVVQKLLGTPEERSANQDAWEAQEQKEQGAVEVRSLQQEGPEQGG